MSEVIISPETKTRLLLAVSDGRPIPVSDILLTSGDRDFQMHLITVATQAKNKHFFASLKELLADQQQKHNEWRVSRPLPEGYPQGLGFKKFLEMHGFFYFRPQYFRIVSREDIERTRQPH